MSRRRLGAVVAAAGATLLVAAAGMSQAGAAPPSAVGWWFELQLSGLPVTVPVPAVPAGGLFVQQGADGPTAYGALRYDVAPGGSVLVTLVPAVGSTTTGADLQACATTAAWAATPDGPGAWDDRPAFNSTCTPGRIAGDGSAVAFAFDARFTASGVLDVAVVPGPGATPFAVAFEAPGGDSIEAAAGAAPRPTPTTASTSTTISAVPSGGPITSPPAVRPTPPVARPPVPAASLTPTSVAAPAQASVPTRAAGAVLDALGFTDHDRAARAWSLSGASLIIVGWWLGTARAVPAPKLRGALRGDQPMAIAAVPTGGIGRFAQPRGGAPRRLR